jgi:hypothetical protein
MHLIYSKKIVNGRRIESWDFLEAININWPISEIRIFLLMRYAMPYTHNKYISYALHIDEDENEWKLEQST